MESKPKGNVVSLRPERAQADHDGADAHGRIPAGFFEAVLENAPPMYVARSDGSAIYLNSGYRELFPSTAGAVERHGGDHRATLTDRHREIVRKVAHTGATETLRIAIQAGRAKKQYLSRHFPILDANKNLVAVAGTFMDSTREAEAETRLKRERKRFLDITRAASDWIWETDERGRFTFVSDRVAQAIGLPAVLLKGRNLGEIGTFVESERDPNPALEAIDLRAPFRKAPFRVELPDGGTRLFLLSAVPVFEDDGRFAGFRGTSDDVTERMKAEIQAARSRTELEQALDELKNKNLQLEITARRAQTAAKAKDEFLATMSHELRTPLNAVIGFAEIMQLEAFGALSSRYKEYVGDILHSGKHLLSLIEDILDIARIESDRIPLEVSPRSLADLIRDARILVEGRARAKELDISHLTYDGPETLNVDVTRCLQIFANLIGNAVKFTPKGGHIGLDVAVAAEDPSMVDVTIWDDGPGISAQHQEMIFEAFQQAHDGIYRRDKEGVGLGLTLSRRLARLMGGDITVESAAGLGSRFTVRLPRAI